MSGCQSRMCCCNTGQGSCSHTASASFIHTSWPAPTHFSTICNRSSHNCTAQYTRVRVTRRGRYNNDEEVRKGEEGGGERTRRRSNTRTTARQHTSPKVSSVHCCVADCADGMWRDLLPTELHLSNGYFVTHRGATEVAHLPGARFHLNLIPLAV